MSDYPLRVRYYTSAGTYRDGTFVGTKHLRRVDAESQAIQVAARLGEAGVYRLSNDERRSPSMFLVRYVRQSDGSVTRA